MKHSCLACVVACLVVYSSSPGGGFQLNEHGARGVGMGGAYVARPFDPSAIFVNPAGLTNLQGWNASGGVMLILPSIRFRGLVPSHPVPETKMKSQLFYPPNAYVSYSGDNGLAFGMGVFTMYGLGTDWPDGWAGRVLSLKVDLKTYFLNPTVAYRVSDMISVGVGVTYIPSTVFISRAVRTGFTDSSGNSIEPKLELEGTGSGYGFNAGILLSPAGGLTIGFSYRSRSTIDLDGDVKFHDVPSSLKSVFQDGPGKSSLTTPASLWGGVAYKVADDLSVEVDYQLTTWSTYDSLKVTLEKAINGQTEIAAPRMYQDVYMVRVGAEYAYSDVWTLRAGYIFDKNPIQDAYLEPSLPDADRHDFTVGAGYRLSDQVTIDVSYMFVRFQQRTVRNSIPEFNFNGTYNSSAHLFGFSISYAWGE